MFSKWFGKDEDTPSRIEAPEIMGLRLGGAFEIDDLKLKLIEPKLTVDGVARTQLIQAVGKVKLDETTTVLRYYTDDEGFLQVLLTGGMTENHISDVKLWYFYETKGVGSDSDWKYLLDNTISTPATSIDDQHYTRVWESTGNINPPVAMTETTYAEDGTTSQTDQFAMLYEREVENGLYEYAMLAGEEKIIGNQADRCLVTSTGFDIQPADIDIIG